MRLAHHWKELSEQLDRTSTYGSKNHASASFHRQFHNRLIKDLASNSSVNGRKRVICHQYISIPVESSRESNSSALPTTALNSLVTYNGLITVAPQFKVSPQTAGVDNFAVPDFIESQVHDDIFPYGSIHDPWIL
jgi:hypothetical protein